VQNILSRDSRLIEFSFVLDPRIKQDSFILLAALTFHHELVEINRPFIPNRTADLMEQLAPRKKR